MSEPYAGPLKEDTPQTGRMTRVLAWLSVTDPRDLAQEHHSSRRMELVGISVLITGLFASLAWGYFFTLMLHSLWKVLPLAVFFGFAMLNIDRNLIAAVRPARGLSGMFPLVLRLLLAGLIGLFLSQPLLLALFQEDIRSELQVMQQQQVQAFQNREDVLYHSRLQPYQSQLDSLQQQLNQSWATAESLRLAYLREADGSGGSHRVGLGRIAALKQAAFLGADSTWKRLEARSTPERIRLRQLLDSMQASQAADLAAFRQRLSSGYLAQVEALSSLAAGHAPVRERIWLLVAIMSLIEVMPVLAKYLMPASAAELDRDLYRTLARLERERMLEGAREDLTLRSQKARDWNRQRLDAFYRAQEAQAEGSDGELSPPSQGSLKDRWRSYRERTWQQEL